MEFFVSPSGDDANPGTEQEPYLTIARGLHGARLNSTLQPGDILTLRGGAYVEAVRIKDLAGTPGNKITIRSFNGERAVIDSGIEAFRVTGAGAWIPAVTVDPAAHPDEWASCQTFPPAVQPSRGAFLDPPYRRLVTYSTQQDFRSDKQTFDKIFNLDPSPEGQKRSPWKVTSDKFVPILDSGREFTFPWVYMGPGLIHSPKKPDGQPTNRVHVRLSHTTLNIPGLEDYLGPTDPNAIALAVCDVKVETLRIENSRCLIFSNLTVRFGGDDTILIDHCHCLAFDQVDVFALTGGIRFGALTGATFRNCRFDGGSPPWFFRADRKGEYFCLVTDQGERLHNKLGKATVGMLMYGEGYNRRDFEIHHCEFVNGHDLYLVATNMHFHHNWIDNLQDEGMMLDAQPSASGRIHSNVITRCLSPISMAIKEFTAGPWFIYRNLIDLRAPTAGHRPRFVGDTAVFRFGNTFKSNETAAPDGPHDVFHNTFLVADQQDDAAYLHYLSDLSPHLRRSFNNIFVAVNPSTESDRAITLVPPPSFPGPTDGNLYHRFGTATAAAFRSPGYTFKCVDFRDASYANLDELHNSTLFEQSKAQYAPGYEANSLLTDPGFRQIGADGGFDLFDDLRLREGSPAGSAGVVLPPDLQALDDEVESSDDTVALPIPASPGIGIRGFARTIARFLRALLIPASRDIGCYQSNSRLNVGVDGRRHFPMIRTIP